MEAKQQSPNLLHIIRQKDKQLRLKWNHDQSIERQRNTRQKKPSFIISKTLSNELEILRSTSRLSTHGAYTEKQIQKEIKPQQRYFIPSLVDLCGEAIAFGFEQLCKSWFYIFHLFL